MLFDMQNEELERVTEEFDVFLDQYTGKHEKDNWLKQSLYADTVQVRKDLIIKEFRNTIDSYANSRIQEFVDEVEELTFEGCPYEGTIVRAILNATAQKYISKEGNK